MRFRALVVLVLVLASLPSAASASTVFVGTFHVRWGDGATERRVEYALALDGGGERRVSAGEAMLQAAGGLRALDEMRVRIEGSLDADGTVRAMSIEHASPVPREPLAAVTGSRAFATVLCKFGDVPAEPRTPSWYAGIMGSAWPGQDFFWRNQSYGLLNLDGSGVSPYVTLPNPRSHYLQSNGEGKLGPIAQDCATAADAYFDFPSFHGVVFMLNAGIGCCAWGGSATITADGQTRSYRAAWIPTGGQDPAILSHEMGHALGFPHSSGPYASTYDSEFDVMSATYGAVRHPVYGHMGMGTIAYHRDLDGWIASERKHLPTQGTRTTITLQPLGDPQPGQGYQMAQIPISSSPQEFYTVEARRKRGGFDDGLEVGEGIVIHRVMPSRSDRDAQVVDPDGNGNPNDAAAVWTVGETYWDRRSGARVEVLASNADGSFTVSIGHQPPSIRGEHTDGATVVREGGSNDTYLVTLESEPIAPVTVSGSGPRVSLSSVTFTPSNWTTPQAMTVAAIDDDIDHPPSTTETIGFSVATTDPEMASLTLPPIEVEVLDDDDMTAPYAVYANESRLVALRGSEIDGYAYDDESGLDRIEMTLVSLIDESPNEIEVQMCDRGSLFCNWIANLPADASPGLYRLTIVAVDVAGNRQSPGRSLTLVVA